MGKQLIPTGTKRNDCVQTPVELALDIVNHFKPQGKILEPCKGDGSFIQAFETYNLISQLSNPNQSDLEWAWTEIKEGKDFFNWEDKVDWIITNPPYSKMRLFMQHSMKVSDNIVFLTTINHLWLKARKPTVHFHSLRHGYATHCVRQGVKLPYLQIMLGHSDLATTSVYLRVAPLEAATDVLNKW